MIENKNPDWHIIPVNILIEFSSTSWSLLDILTVPPTDMRPVNWPIAWHSIHQNNNNLWDNGGHSLMITRQMTIKASNVNKSCHKDHTNTVNKSQIWRYHLPWYHSASLSGIIRQRRKWNQTMIFITARKWSLGQGNVFTNVCHSVQWVWCYFLSHCLVPCSF